MCNKMETKENQLRNKIVDEIGLISFAKKIVIQEKKIQPYLQNALW